MAAKAKVHSFEAINRFRVALIKFAEEALGSLGTLQQEIIRLMQWVSNDQPGYWKKQVQKGFNDVAQARAELARARLKTVGGKTPQCLEEKKALRKAKHALAHAQKQIEVVRHWAVKIQQEADEFRGRLGRLDMMANLEIPKMIALLENMITALEEYVAIQAVEAGAVTSSSGTTTPTNSTVASTGTVPANAGTASPATSEEAGAKTDSSADSSTELDSAAQSGTTDEVQQ